MTRAASLLVLLAACGGEVGVPDAAADGAGDGASDALFICDVSVSPHQAKACVECALGARVTCQEICAPVRGPGATGACIYSGYDAATTLCGDIRCGAGCTCALPEQSICTCSPP